MPVIVVDGRTDREKLVELLGVGAEQTALDFKATLDLREKVSKQSLDFVKDAISMGNLPRGGYIVIGVDDRGSPAHDQEPLVVDQFDSANLRAKIGRYVDAPVEVTSQVHELHGRAVVLVYVAPNPDGLPVPTKQVGQYDKGDRTMVTVFNEGEVFVREGTSNVVLRFQHWPQLLGRYREHIQEEARRDIDDLVRRVAEGLRVNPGVVQLDPGMDDDTLTEALLSALEAGGPAPRVRQFLHGRAQAASAPDEDSPETRLRALDQISLVACQAALYQADDVFGQAIDALWRVYNSQRTAGGNEVPARASRFLDIAVRVLAIGALCVRQEAWHLLRTLASRPLDDYGYVWGSWLRHAVTMASRAGVFRRSDQPEGGQAISMSRALALITPGLRPDYPADAALPPLGELAENDWLLNSLCQFDLWWCLLSVADMPEGASPSGAFFPSCAALNQWRAQPTLDHIAGDEEVRRRAFGAAGDADIADAIQLVVEMAVTQSHNYGGWWSGLNANPRVLDFVETHATQRPDTGSPWFR